MVSQNPICSRLISQFIVGELQNGLRTEKPQTKEQNSKTNRGKENPCFATDISKPLPCGWYPAFHLFAVSYVPRRHNTSAGVQICLLALIWPSLFSGKQQWHDGIACQSMPAHNTERTACSTHFLLRDCV